MIYVQSEIIGLKPQTSKWILLLCTAACSSSGIGHPEIIRDIIICRLHDVHTHGWHGASIRSISHGGVIVDVVIVIRFHGVHSLVIVVHYSRVVAIVVAIGVVHHYSHRAPLHHHVIVVVIVVAIHHASIHHHVVVVIADVTVVVVAYHTASIHHHHAVVDVIGICIHHIHMIGHDWLQAIHTVSIEVVAIIGKVTTVIDSVVTVGIITHSIESVHDGFLFSVI